MRGSLLASRGVEPCRPVVAGHTCRLFTESIKNDQGVFVYSGQWESTEGNESRMP